MNVRDSLVKRLGFDPIDIAAALFDFDPKEIGSRTNFFAKVAIIKCLNAAKYDKEFRVWEIAALAGYGVDQIKNGPVCYALNRHADLIGKKSEDGRKYREMYRQYVKAFNSAYERIAEVVSASSAGEQDEPLPLYRILRWMEGKGDVVYTVHLADVSISIRAGGSYLEVVNADTETTTYIPIERIHSESDLDVLARTMGGWDV